MFWAKKNRRLKHAAVGLKLPESCRNNWPELLADSCTSMTIEELPDPELRVLFRKPKPIPGRPQGFKDQRVTLKRDEAEVILISGWGDRWSYDITLWISDPLKSLDFGKEIQNKLIGHGFTLLTKDLSYVDELLSAEQTE